ncbi:MAG: PAS domain-containing protein [Rhizonema sp. NSF051]|nr:PAS domain-containing protein [Rhizonema sp. NSF051]
MPDPISKNQLANENLLLYEQVSTQIVKQGMILQFADGNVKACNRVAESILEPIKEQLMGCNLSEAIREDGSAFPAETHPALVALRTGNSCSNVIMGLYKPNREIVWLLLSSEPLFQQQGSKPYAVVTNFIDITASKSTQSESHSSRPKKEDSAVVDALIELQLTNEQFEQASSMVNCFIYNWDLQRRFVERTQGLTRLLGYTSAEAEPTAAWWRSRIHPDDRQRIRNQFKASLAQGDHYSMEYRLRHKDNYYVWVQDQGFAVRADDQILKIVGITTDISDRKQTEEALRQSEEHYRYLADAIPNIVFSTDKAGRADYVNQRWQEYSGLTLEETIGYGWLKAVHPDDVPIITQPWQEALEEGKLYEKEHRFRKASNGMYCWHLVRGYPLKDDQGNVVKWFGTCTDIHEKKQLEEERKQVLEREKTARSEAESANRIKDQFLAILSHELRSPLNPILGWTKLLKSRKFDAVVTARALDTIERNAHLQIQLIEDLLDVSRILRGKLNLNAAAVNLSSVIETALETVRLTAEVKSIELRFLPPDNRESNAHLEHPKFLVTGDANRLQQVIGNLLSNAIKFTPIGGCVQVHLSVEANRNYAAIAVQDTGIGISAEFLPQVFEYFCQADSSTTRRFGGLGLGLAIVHHLVELHGGTVTAESPGEQQGATFTVRLPLIKASVLEEKVVGRFDSLLFCLDLRILIVDDDVDTREFIKFLLEDHKASVTVATSANEAYAILAQSKFDLLISDLGMPEVDGYNLINQIRAMPPELGGEIPAIALTAYATEIDRRRVLAAGFQQHIAKPVEPDKLLAAIADLLGQIR